MMDQKIFKVQFNAYNLNFGCKVHVNFNTLMKEQTIDLENTLTHSSMTISHFNKYGKGLSLFKLELCHLRQDCSIA